MFSNSSPGAPERNGMQREFSRNYSPALSPDLDEDDELLACDAASADAETGQVASSEDVPPTPPRTRAQKPGIIAGIVGVAALVIAGLLATVGSPKPAGDEKVHANWRQHVAELNDRNANNATKVLKHVNRGGKVFFGSNVSFDGADLDEKTTEEVKSALEAGDLAAATEALQEAQDIPHGQDENGDELPRLEPQLSDGLQQAVLQGDTEFFHIFLYDSCDEDGDVVKIILDGEVFAVVPITNNGITLSVPVGGQGTSVSLEGVRDGGGGITVACRTSQGDYFMSAMFVGQVQQIGFVR